MSEEPGRFIKLDKNKCVIGIRNGMTITDDEIQSDIGEIGQIMQEDGSFITLEPVEVNPQTTIEDKVNYLYYKSMGVI